MPAINTDAFASENAVDLIDVEPRSFEHSDYVAVVKKALANKTGKGRKPKFVKTQLAKSFPQLKGKPLDDILTEMRRTGLVEPDGTDLTHGLLRPEFVDAQDSTDTTRKPLDEGRKFYTDYEVVATPSGKKFIVRAKEGIDPSKRGEIKAEQPTLETIISVHNSEAEALAARDGYADIGSGASDIDLRAIPVNDERVQIYKDRTDQIARANFKDSPRVKRIIDALGSQKVMDYLRKNNVSTSVVEAISNSKGDVGEGVYSSRRKSLNLSLDGAIRAVGENASEEAVIEQLSRVMNHELIHALYDLGVITKDDFQMMARYTRKRARPLDLQKNNSPRNGMTYFEEAETLYQEYAEEAAGDLTGAERNTFIKEYIEEEAIAEAFRDWAVDRKFVTGRPASIFKRITKFFRTMGGLLRENGITETEQMFDLIQSGEKVGGTTTQTSGENWTSGDIERFSIAQDVLKPMVAEGDTPLFHLTSIDRLASILGANALRRGDASRGAFVSLTRNFRYQGFNKDQMDVQLTLSRNSIKNSHRLSPIEEPRYPRLSEEREERVPGEEISNLKTHLRGINYIGGTKSRFDNNTLIRDPETMQRHIEGLLSEIDSPAPLFYKGEKLSVSKKHTAKKIAAGRYEYRGAEIYQEKDIMDFWNITPRGETGPTDATNTLGQAKEMVDMYEDNKFSIAEKVGGAGLPSSAVKYSVAEGKPKAITAPAIKYKGRTIVGKPGQEHHQVWREYALSERGNRKISPEERMAVATGVNDGDYEQGFMLSREWGGGFVGREEAMGIAFEADQLNPFFEKSIRARRANETGEELITPFVRYSIAPPAGSPELAAAMQGSVVVNTDGSPRTMYHGTKADFEVFSDMPSAGQRQDNRMAGHYFTPDRNFADDPRFTGEGGKIMEGYLVLKRPYVTGERGQSIPVPEALKNMIVPMLEPLGPTRRWAEGKVAEASENMPSFINVMVNAGVSGTDQRTLLKLGGFDGMIDGTEYVVFDDAQVLLTNSDKFSLVSNTKSLADIDNETIQQWAFDVRRPGKKTITRNVMARNQQEAEALAKTSPYANRGAYASDNDPMSTAGISEMENFRAVGPKTRLPKAPKYSIATVQRMRPEQRIDEIKNLAVMMHFDGPEIQEALNATARPGATSTLVFMNPEDYIAMATAGLRNAGMSEVYAENIDKGLQLNRLMRLTLQEGQDGAMVTVQHDGRHRVRALQELGYDLVPVLLETDSLQWEKASGTNRELASQQFAKQMTLPSSVIHSNQQGDQVLANLLDNNSQELTNKMIAGLAFDPDMMKQGALEEMANDPSEILRKANPTDLEYDRMKNSNLHKASQKMAKPIEDAAILNGAERVYKSTAFGKYAGYTETSVGLEAIFPRADGMEGINKAASEIMRTANTNKQEEAFAAMAVPAGSVPADVGRPGMTIFFYPQGDGATTRSIAQVEDIIDKLATKAVSGFTAFKSNKALQLNEGFEGLRFIWTPEYVPDMTPSELNQNKLDILSDFDDIAQKTNELGIGSVQTDTYIAALGSEYDYDATIEQLEAPVGGRGELGNVGEHGPWRRTVRSGVEERFERREAEARSGTGDSDVVDDSPKFSIRRYSNLLDQYEYQRATSFSPRMIDRGLG